MEVLVLCLLFGVSLAQPGISFPKVTDLNQGYEPLNTYTYKYDACVSSFFITEKQFAGLRITGDVEFYIASYTEAYLKIINPKLYEVNGTWYCTSDSLKVSSYSDELTPLLEQPVKFEYSRGKVGRIFCDKDEPDYILNIKRGILSMLHHNFTTPEPSYYDKKPRMYNNWEYGSHGMCGSTFNVRYKTNPDTSKIDEMEVDKTLDVMNCTVKPRVVSNVPGMRCNSKDCDVIDEPFRIDILTQCKMTGTESKFAVKSCKLTGIYSFAPSQLKGSGTTRVKQMMDFKEVKSYAQEIYLENPVERTLQMTTEEEQKPLTDEQRNKMVAKVTKLIGYLMNDYEQKTWMAWRFPSLIDVLRKADKETLYKIWNTCYTHEKHRYWLLEALPYVHKEDVFALITEKIWQKELIPTEAVPVLRGLALTVNPTEQMCLHISDLCYREQVQKDESLKKTCYLSSGALMYEYCKDKGKDCLLTQANKMKAKLLNADFEEKIIILKSIGNFGHKTLYAPLVDIILDTQTPRELRVTATYALRRIGPQVPNKVIPVMLQIFQGMNNDEELRMACFVVFIDCNPSPAVFRLVAKQIKKSNSNQLLAFVVSYVKGIAYSKYPCDEKIAKTARTALRMLRKFQPGILSSKWLHYGDFSDLHQIGGSVDWQRMSTPSSIIPRALTTKFKLHILGRSVNMFETGIRGEGIQELLKRVVGPRGHYTKNKSWFGFLRPKRSVDSSSYDKEVGEIKDMLPIVDYEEEKPKGSMYFKVLGKELFYNYFTYDDVRELVEDGVIRVNQDLKDVLKKGKKWNMTKVFMPVEIKTSHPSCVGLPLKFTLQSVLLVHLNTTIKAEVEPKFFIPIPDKVTVYGKANISMYHYTWGKMFVYLPQLAAGNKMTVKTNVTTGLAGKFHYNHKDYSTSMEFDLPEKRKQVFSAEKNAYTFTKYYKPYSYKSTKMDGFEIGDVTEVFGEQGYHRYANWTLKTSEGKYLSVNDQNELILADTPTVFKVFFVNTNHYFVKLYVEGKGFVKVKPDSKGCLETVHDYRYPKLFKIIMTRKYTSRHIRLATVVFIHSDETKNPTEWTTSTAPLNTDQVMLFKQMIEKVPSEGKYAEKWRFVSDYPIDNDVETFHPRHMKIVYVTPTDEGKVCLRPDESMESVFSVKRHYENESEVCFNQTILGCDVCMSGRYIKSLSSDPIAFPFCGPMKFNVSVQPSTYHAKTLKIKFGKSEPYSDTYKTWRAGMYLTGTTPEKKVETVIAYNATNNQFNFTADFYQMHPWLKKVCITNKVVYGNEVKFFLNFGEDCEDYKIQSRITVKEPSRTELHIMTSYNKLPDSTLLTMCYKLLKKFVKQYYDKLNEIRRGPNTPNTAEFVVKFKTDQIVDLELIGPSKTLKMENIKQKTPGFIPRASEHFSTFMQMMAWSSPVCIADHTTFKTFDDVEFQYSLPDHCMHVLTKDCTKNQTFMVLMSTEPQATHKKILEIFVEKNKIRVEYMDKGQYQIQVNGKIVPLQDKELRINSVATIIEESQKEELHVWCDIGLRIALVRGTKVEVRVSPWFVNRTCGICGDCNGEQYFDLKTPMGEEFTLVDTQKYGHMWMVPENTCTKGGCHLKKEYKLISKRVDEQDYDCFPTVPVLRCYDECLVTKSTTTTFPMTCVRTGSKEASKIFKDMEKRVLDLTGSEIHYYDDLREDIECDCSRCGQ